MTKDEPQQKSNPTGEPASEQAAASLGEIHSIFGPWQKKFIVLAVTIAAFFSPLSANIYFPALNTIARDLHLSNAQINLTVTTYLIFQGLAPTFVGGFSDNAGRRPAYIICFVIYIAANLGLALQSSYPALLLLRCLQSSGSSGTVSLANAAVADVATSAERGSYIAITSLTSILAPSIAPVLGGVLSQYLGWKWIFWFLVIFSTIFFTPLLLFLPETCHKIVGNGSIPPPAWNKSLWNVLLERRRSRAGNPIDFTKRDELAKDRHTRFPNPLATLVIVLDREAGPILLSNGLLFSAYYAIASSVPSQFKRIYGFNNLHVSLVYLPIAVGSLISAFTTGKMVDWNYRRHARRLGFPVDKKRQQDLGRFPIEKARLQVALPPLYLGAIAMLGYGWALHYKTNLAGPLFLMFFMGYAVIAAFNCMSILMIDIYPGKPATATAANNLVRCLLGAGASAVAIPMIEALGNGWTYTLMAMVWLAFSPLLWTLMKYGPRWRRERKEMEEQAEEDGLQKRESNAVEKLGDEILEEGLPEEATANAIGTEEGKTDQIEMEDAGIDEVKTEDREREDVTTGASTEESKMRDEIRPGKNIQP